MEKVLHDDGRVTGPWTLAQLKAGEVGAKPNGMKVFSCFHCGGGSTMGYKLAGFEVLGGVEIDPEMSRIYVKNHAPKHEFLMGVQEFKRLPDDRIPAELFELDVLDGSPPCSSFSTAGSREDAWGKKKKFREGQAEQVLDELFFDFIDIAKRLRPKVVVAENVKGLVIGKAKGYVKMIFQAFDDAGYDVQLYLLNASRMGVPQARERTFFIARRRDLGIPALSLDFSEDVIPVAAAIAGAERRREFGLGPKVMSMYDKVTVGKSFGEAGNGSFFSWRKINPNAPATTVTATHCMVHWSEKRRLSCGEVSRLQSFPDDYDFMGVEGPYVCGMSVPPLMMQRVALEVARALGAKPEARRPKRAKG